MADPNVSLLALGLHSSLDSLLLSEPLWIMVMSVPWRTMSEINVMTICQTWVMLKMRGCLIQKQKQEVFYLRMKIASPLESDAI